MVYATIFLHNSFYTTTGAWGNFLNTTGVNKESTVSTVGFGGGGWLENIVNKGFVLGHKTLSVLHGK